jgi:hypothetical protein
MEQSESHFYANQEITLETPERKFKGYIKKIENDSLYIILFASFIGKQTFELGAEDYDSGEDLSILKNSKDLSLISSGFSKTYIHKALLKEIVKNSDSLSLKIQVDDSPLEREGREFLRINAFIQFIYEEISIDEFIKIKDGYISRPSFTTSVYGIYGIAAPRIYQPEIEKDSDAAVNPKIEKLLVAINSKLDVILSFLNPETSIFSDIKEKLVSISGSGIMWTEEEERAEGDKLNYGSIIKITMLFPSVPQFIIKALAQVAKISKSSTPSPIVSVACKFISINEYDRDEIIKFTLEQQRRQIKKQSDAPIN